MTNYIGIYWTRPVNWAGFTTLSSDPEVAETQSKTIRYQRSVVKRFIREEKGAELVAEWAFMEAAPDRAHQATFADLPRKIMHLPERYKCATLLWVDFKLLGNWRFHVHLEDILKDYQNLGLDPRTHLAEPDLDFNPKEHFTNWRDKTNARRKQAPIHRETILDTVLGEAKMTWKQKADLLNTKGLLTRGNQPWTEDNLRKFCDVYGFAVNSMTEKN